MWPGTCSRQVVWNVAWQNTRLAVCKELLRRSCKTCQQPWMSRDKRAAGELIPFLFYPSTSQPNLTGSKRIPPVENVTVTGKGCDSVMGAWWAVFSWCEGEIPPNTVQISAIIMDSEVGKVECWTKLRKKKTLKESNIQRILTPIVVLREQTQFIFTTVPWKRLLMIIIWHPLSWFLPVQQWEWSIFCHRHDPTVCPSLLCSYVSVLEAKRNNVKSD